VTLEAAVRLSLGTLDLDVALSVGAGEIVAVLGPNGAGKTTLLRTLAGLVPFAEGRVVLDGVVLHDDRVFVPPERRPIGVVFQDGALFGHMTVADNVAFGLRARGVGRAAARVWAHEWLERLGVASLASMRPAQLSGGQAQRVAIARALAVEPRLLLLDEPLSALDASARPDVRRDLRRHLSAFAGVRLVVTHDPTEALALADRVVVLEAGRIVQTGAPHEVAARPRSAYVADLAGVNLLRGRSARGVVALEGGGVLSAADAPDGDVYAVVHPRAIALYRTAPAGSPRNVWPGTVTAVDHEGERMRVVLDGPPTLVAEVTRAAAGELMLEPGARVWMSVKATEVAAYRA
jgi:molybdate transport system ATP-binding protein